MVRLVKGAYWDTEIKRAQERGLDGYPVFTRKAMTDLNYVACAQRLLALRPRLFPQFATHNALTVATVLELAGGNSGFEFQRLHGMGEALYAQLSEDRPELGLPHLCAGRQPSRPAGLSGAAAAGEWRQFVVRGAGGRRQRAGCRRCCGVRPTSSAAADSARPSEHPPAARPLSTAAAEFARHRIRRARGARAGLLADRCGRRQPDGEQARDRCATAAHGGNARSRRARAGFRELEPDGRRARARKSLERAADLLEQRAAHFIALLQREGGKTLDDAVSEVREATDFCRYYAAQGPKAVRRGRGDAGADRREQCAAPARPRRLRRDLARGIFRWRSSWARSRRR